MTTSSEFQPDYNNLLDVLHNRKPRRLPLYEHHIETPFISKYLGEKVEIEGDRPEDYEAYYKKLVGFWKDMTYDGFDYEAGICEIFPDHGAILGGRPGPIQNRQDFENYPFDTLPEKFWLRYSPHLDAIRKVLPDGMKAFGGVGYGIFEASQDLVGFEYLCVMQYMDPDLFADLFVKIGDLFVELWTEMVKRYDDIFVFYRMGDDLGFKTNTLLEPDTIRTHIMPQYKRVIEIIHKADKKFLLHSCGNIFVIMDDLINLDIDAKHSNEDAIAPFEKWIDLYNEKIGLFGGIDVNTLSLNTYEDVYRIVMKKGKQYRDLSKGYGIGSGNSIPEYVPVEGFKAMIDAVIELRRLEDESLSS